MRYEWPDKVVINVLSKGSPVEKLIVHCMIGSKFKNDFPMDSIKTNEKGEIELIKEQLLKAINDSKEEFPMDYYGELSDCDGLKIIIEDKSGLEKRIERLKEFYPKEAEKLKKFSANSANLNFVRFEGKYNLPFPERVVINLERV